MKHDMKEILKECRKLGIININAHTDLPLDLIVDVVQAVKETNLNFDELAKQAKNNIEKSNL